MTGVSLVVLTMLAQNFEQGTIGISYYGPGLAVQRKGDGLVHNRRNA